MDLGMVDKDEFVEFKTMTIIETTHGSLQLHIPAKAVRRADLKKGTMMRCFVNSKTKEIIYVPKGQDMSLKIKIGEDD